MPKIISLNSVEYVIKGRIERYSQTPFATAFRTIGLQRREDVQTATGFVFGNPIYGFGRRRLSKIDDARQILQIWDSQVMTHFESQVGLAPLRVADTGELYVLRGSAVFKGSLWSIWFHDGGVGGNQEPTARALTSATDTSWGGGGRVSDSSDASNRGAFDLTVHKDRLVALWYLTSGHNIAFSTDGVTWTQATTDITAALLTSRSGSTDFDGGLLATVGNELVAVIYNEAAGTIQFFSSADSGVTMASEGQLIPSNSGVKGVAVYPGIDGATKLLVMTENGVYEVDTAPAQWTATLIIPIRYHVDNGRRAVVHQGAVWIPVGANSEEPAGMIRYTVSGDTRLIEHSVGVNGEALGLDAFDGVPSDKLGPFNWLKSTGKYLLAAVGGTAASRNGHLLIHNGFGWHYLARNSAAANERCYWVDDINGTPHYANRTGTSTTDTLGVQNALVNPASGLAIARELDGILVRPEFDGGMPRYNAAWLEVFYDAVDLSATNAGEYIAVSYGLNGAAANSTSLGDILSGDLDLLFGTGGVGVSARSIQIQETYNRDATVNTHTPTGRSMELTYLKKPPKLEAWAFVVDLEETAQRNRATVEATITSLETARDSVPKVAFVYGKMTSVNVVVEPPLQFSEELEEEDIQGGEERTGTVQVLVREVN